MLTWELLQLGISNCNSQLGGNKLMIGIFNRLRVYTLLSCAAKDKYRLHDDILLNRRSRCQKMGAQGLEVL